jgi:hypothetical protein
MHIDKITRTSTVGASAEQPHSGNGEGSGARFNTLAPIADLSAPKTHRIPNLFTESALSVPTKYRDNAETSVKGKMK